MKRAALGIALVLFVAGFGACTADGATKCAAGFEERFRSAPLEGPSSKIDEATRTIQRRLAGLRGVRACRDHIARGDVIRIEIPSTLFLDKTFNERATIRFMFGAGRVAFRPVRSLVPTSAPAYASTPPDCSIVLNQPANPLDDADQVIDSCSDSNSDIGTKLSLAPAEILGADVADAMPTRAAVGGAWEVEVTFTDAGARRFQSTTGRLACSALGIPQRQLAIVVDDVVISHPQMGPGVVCNAGIMGGTARITGDFGEAQARVLAAILSLGPNGQLSFSIPVSGCRHDDKCSTDAVFKLPR